MSSTDTWHAPLPEGGFLIRIWTDEGSTDVAAQGLLLRADADAQFAELCSLIERHQANNEVSVTVRRVHLNHGQAFTLRPMTTTRIELVGPQTHVVRAFG